VFKHIGSKMGEHTIDVLGDAGYSAAEIASFNEAGIFGDTVKT